MTPEEKVAQRVIQKYNLVPPVRISELITEFADVEEVYLPFDADAIFLNQGDRPRVLLNMDRTHRRKRFTLGHELGHIKIPWHIGTLVCHTKESSVPEVDRYLYGTTELEANRFAAELLMPTTFLQRVCEQDEGAMVWHRSPQTAINIFGDIAPSQLSMDASNMGQFHFQNYIVNWWEFRFTENTIFTNVPREKSTEMLKRILLDVESDLVKRQKYSQVINGVCGSANNGAGTEMEYFSQLKQRFNNYKHKLDIVTSHPDFDDFLRKKSIEIIRRKIDSGRR